MYFCVFLLFQPSIYCLAYRTIAYYYAAVGIGRRQCLPAYFTAFATQLYLSCPSVYERIQCCGYYRRGNKGVEGGVRDKPAAGNRVFKTVCDSSKYEAELAYLSECCAGIYCGFPWSAEQPHKQCRYCRCYGEPHKNGYYGNSGV